MNESDSLSVVQLAKGLFPVTKPERFDSLGLALLAFPDADVAKKVLVELSHEVGVDKLDIPAIRNRLTAELHRRGVFRDVVMREAEQRADRRRIDREAAEKSKAEVDAFLAGLDDGDLAAFKESALAAMHVDARPFYERLDPAKSVPLRAAMYTRMNAGVP